MEVKIVGTFLVILLKLATPSLPPKTKWNFAQNGWDGMEMSAFFGHNIARGSRGTTGWTQSRAQDCH